MNNTQRVARETAEDLFFGQVVIIWARWFLIFAGAGLTLWNSTTSSELVTRMLAVLPLIAVNFFLHGRYLLERPANATVLAIMSLLDLGIVTAVLLAWQQPGGLHSPYFVFYYPVIFAFALVFPARWSVPYTALAMASYTLICVFAGPTLSIATGDPKLLVMRLVTLAAMGGLGTYFWRIQRTRRAGEGAAIRPAAGAPVATEA